MRVLILGGDGFCGWPTALHLAAVGHEVSIVDDLSRRRIDRELGTESLTPIRELKERVTAWNQGKRQGEGQIAWAVMDLCKAWVNSGWGMRLRSLIEQHDRVIHFAEQRAAPYSMKSQAHRQYTVMRNIGATTNLLNALLELPRPLTHLGTMGVYGYEGSGTIPEGWINWGNEKRLHPMKPGSVYHATKCMDQTLFEFYARNDNLAITDLHQGIVWGTETEETARDERLINRFDYDGDYGTVLNRFLMQAALGYLLTVHGTGGQTRAFIHIRDTVRCIRAAIENPPGHGEYRIYNQAAESLRLRDLANKVAGMAGAQVEYVDNPRKEAEENGLEFDNSGLQELGWSPITLDDGLMNEVMGIADRHKDRCDPSVVPCTSRW